MKPLLDDEKVFENVITHKYVVREVTHFVVEHSKTSSNPSQYWYGSGTPVCECESRDEAERIASALCGNSDQPINVTVNNTVSKTNSEIAEQTAKEVARALRRACR